MGKVEFDGLSGRQKPFIVDFSSVGRAFNSSAQHFCQY